MGCFGWRIVRVVGRSMEPILAHGDYAVVSAGRWRRRWRVGDIVLVDHSQRGRIVKCIGSESQGGYRLWSPGPWSPESSALGTVAGTDIIGQVRWRISPGGISRCVLETPLGEGEITPPL